MGITPPEKAFNLIAALIDADHIIAQVGENRPRNESDVPGTNHTDIHLHPLFPDRLCGFRS